MEDEVERVRKEYEERKKKKEEEDKKKEDEKKDGEKGDEKDKEKDKAKDDNAKEEKNKEENDQMVALTPNSDENDFLTASRRRPVPRHQTKNPGSLPSSGASSLFFSSPPLRNAVANVSQRLLQPARLEEARGRDGEAEPRAAAAAEPVSVRAEEPARDVSFCPAGSVIWCWFCIIVPWFKAWFFSTLSLLHTEEALSHDTLPPRPLFRYFSLAA